MDYSTLQAANPYKNQKRKDGILQNIWSALGGRTSTDAWNENMAVQAAEYDAGIAQMMFQNEYNSPSAEVSRMRQAGLNPDLQGIGDVAEAASPMEDPSTPMQSTGDKEIVSQVTGMVFSAFNTALGVVSGLQGMHSVFLDNVAKKVGIDEAISGYAEKLWPSFLPSSPDPSAENDISLYGPNNKFDWKSAALRNAEVFAGRHLNKRYRKRFVDEVQRYWLSGPGQAESYEDWKKVAQARKGYYFERDQFYSDVDSVLNDMIEPLANKLMKITSQDLDTQLAQAQAAQNKAEYDTELYGENGLDPKAEAGATNSERGLSETNNTMVVELNESIGEIISGLKRHAENDHGIKGALANVALVLMASVRLYLANMSTNVSTSSSSSYNPKTGAVSSSRGFSLGF